MSIVRGVVCASAGIGIVCKSFETKPKEIISMHEVVVDVLIP